MRGHTYICVSHLSVLAVSDSRERLYPLFSSRVIECKLVLEPFFFVLFTDSILVAQHLVWLWFAFMKWIEF